MRHGSNFNPEWGYVAPAPGFMQTARLIVIAVIIGATAGAAIVFSLLDRPVAEESVAARTLVAPDPSRPVTAGTSLAAQQRTEPQQIKSPAEAQNSAEQKPPPAAAGAKTRPQQNELATTSTSQRPTSAAMVAEAPAVKDTPSYEQHVSGRTRPNAGPEAAKQETGHDVAHCAAQRYSTLRQPALLCPGLRRAAVPVRPQYGYEPSYGFEQGFAWAPQGPRNY